MKTFFAFIFVLMGLIMLAGAVVLFRLFLLFKNTTPIPIPSPPETLDQRIERLWDALSDDAKDQVRSLKQAHAGGFLSDRDMKADIEKILNAVDIPV